MFQAPTLPLLLVKHINDEPDPPSRHARYPVPPELDRLVLDCLHKNKEARPPSAAVIDDRLAAIELAEPWTAAQARQWWQEYRPGL